MKNHLFVFFFLMLFGANAQSDSIFTDLNYYHLEVCTYAWDWEGLEQFQYLTVESDDPMSDTLRITNQNGTELANLLLDGRKTWLKVHSDSLSTESQYVFSPYYNYAQYNPVDEYFLLYDFDVLDTSSVGDTVVFGDTLDNVSVFISDIDTIEINGVQKPRYRIFTGEHFIREDFIIEGVGGTHPFSPLINEELFGTCTCKYRATYANESDTLVLRDTMMFGGDSNYKFCLTASLPQYEKESLINIYPNPVENGGLITVETGNVENADLLFLDAQGRKVKEVRLSDAKSIYFIEQAFATGTYSVRLIKDGEVVQDEKVVVR